MKSPTIFPPKCSELLLLWLDDYLKIYVTIGAICVVVKTQHFKVQSTTLAFLFKAFHADAMGDDGAHTLCKPVHNTKPVVWLRWQSLTPETGEKLPLEAQQGET